MNKPYWFPTSLLQAARLIAVVLACASGHFGRFCAHGQTVAPRPAIAVRSAKDVPAIDEVLPGLREFFRATARPDGSFQPGVDPEYRGMSDSAYSDLAAVTYAVTLHKTFGWTLPHEAKTGEFLRSRQRPNGDFFNVAGTVSPDSPEGRTYNTTQGLVALHALGLVPRHNPLPTFEAILKSDYKQLPAYSTSFFPLAYLCAGRPIPEQADRGIRALMVQDETGYTNDHVAATFHASHYYRLIGEETPRAKEMVARILRDQKPDGSWMLNMPGRDRHATFDAVFTLVHEGDDSPVCRDAIRRAAEWVLSCRNADGGFGHYPGSTSDADANYFHVGTLVMAGLLKPTQPLPRDPHLLSWGHLMPVVKRRDRSADWTVRADGWIASVSYAQDGARVAIGASDNLARIVAASNGHEQRILRGHDDIVSCVRFQPAGRQVATGSFDHSAALWDAASGRLLHRLSGHRGAVLAVAYSSDGTILATGGVDGLIKLWDTKTGVESHSLAGHKSWISGLAFHPQHKQLVSASSDGTIRIWSLDTRQETRIIPATNAEVRSLALSHDGRTFGAGLRYGTARFWKFDDGAEIASVPGQGDFCAVAISADGRRAAISEGDWNRGGVVKVVDVATGKTRERIPCTGEVLSLDFAPGGHSLVVGGADKVVRSWRIP